MATRTKPARSLRVVSNLLSGNYLIVSVTEGKRTDEYQLISADGAITWAHREDRQRSYRVECGAGVPTSCDCPAGSYGRVCRHLAGSAALIERSYLTPPPADEPDMLDRYGNTGEDVTTDADRDWLTCPAGYGGW